MKVPLLDLKQQYKKIKDEVMSAAALPVYPELEKDQIEYVHDMIGEFIGLRQ